LELEELALGVRLLNWEVILSRLLVTKLSVLIEHVVVIVKVGEEQISLEDHPFLEEEL
jgi:hypothetical protein